MCSSSLRAQRVLAHGLCASGAAQGLCCTLNSQPAEGDAQGDVRKYADCERAVQETVSQFERLDILVNCAAGNFLATAEELSSNGFRTGPPL